MHIRTEEGQLFQAQQPTRVERALLAILGLSIGLLAAVGTMLAVWYCVYLIPRV